MPRLKCGLIRRRTSFLRDDFSFICMSVYSSSSLVYAADIREMSWSIYDMTELVAPIVNFMIEV